jgi:hypothetical protein
VFDGKPSVCVIDGKPSVYVIDGKPSVYVIDRKPSVCVIDGNLPSNICDGNLEFSSKQKMHLGGFEWMIMRNYGHRTANIRDGSEGLYAILRSVPDIG